MVQENCINSKVIVICGPTASGKTSLAVNLAKRIGGEIISADSMNVYKDFNIGTAKPTIEERQEIPHYLIDVVSAEKSFSVGDYKEIATPILEDIISRGKTPIICGGTGFYINSLLYDYSYGNTPQNLITREKYKKIAQEKGVDAVYNELLKKDYQSAIKIHKNDLKRVIRALEIYESGVKKSDIVDNMIPKYQFCAFMIDYPREELYSRINLRVELMIQNGLVEEVKSLISKNITLDNQAMQGIGYKEIYAYLTNDITLEQAIDLIKLNTRHYAKRQLTFFKKLDGLIKLQPQSTDNLITNVLENL